MKNYHYREAVAALGKGNRTVFFTLFGKKPYSILDFFMSYGHEGKLTLCFLCWIRKGNCGTERRANGPQGELGKKTASSWGSNQML